MKLAEPPRILKTQKPVRLVLANGFLGAGKTTALSALAGYLSSQGKRVGYVTNDQAAHLVDTTLVARQGIPVAEVAGGCFCCRFTDLLDAAQTVLDQEPDVLLCEPVGSCTDMVATVLAPLKQFYGAQFDIAPFAVLVDPARVRTLLLREQPDLFPSEVGYIFRKQLEAADAILLTKADTLSEEETARYLAVLAQEFRKPVQAISALHGDGIAAWGASLLTGASEGKHLLRDIDYDTYAQGEAVLGWLNATVEITGNPTFDPAAFVRSLMSLLQQKCQQAGAEIAHVKLTLSDGDHLLRANLTSNATAPDYSAEAWDATPQATLVLNARVRTAPDPLKTIVTDAVNATCAQVHATNQVQTLESFSPSYPRPPYRITSIV